MNSIFIATWGNPWKPGWDSVKYIHENKTLESRSSLPILLDCVEPKPNRVLIIVLDTVVNRFTSSYDELLSQVHSMYSEFIGKDLGIDLKNNNVKILIAPGVGRFNVDGGFIKFDGSLSDFYAYVLFELSKVFLESGDEITVHLDLSHGINFMPSLTLTALRELLSALSLISNVRLKIYNSEPYVKNVTKTLTIHLVEDREVTPILDIKPLGMKGECKFLKVKVVAMSPEERSILKNMRLNRGEVSELNAFLSSVFNGLPLALYTFYPDTEDLREKLERAVEFWRSRMSVARDADEINIVRKVSFAEDFARCIMINFIATMLKLSRKKEVALGDLESVRKNFFSKWSAKFNAMISSDLGKIREDVDKYTVKYTAIKSWTKLYEVFDEKPGGFDPRNFLAHSGLERNIVELKIEGSSIKIRYADNCLEEVVKGCLEGLLKRSSKR
jgi:CRISPR-associated protein Csx1